VLIKEVADLSAVQARSRARKAISGGIGKRASQKVWDTINTVATSGRTPRSFVKSKATSSARRLVTSGVQMTRQELINAIVEAADQEEHKRRVPAYRVPVDFYHKRSRYQKASMDITLGGVVGGVAGGLTGGIPGYVVGHTIGGPSLAVGKYIARRGPKGVRKDYRRFRTRSQAIDGGRFYNAMVKHRTLRGTARKAFNSAIEPINDFNQITKDVKGNVDNRVNKSIRKVVG